MRRAALFAGVRDRVRSRGAMRAGSLLIGLLVSGCLATLSDAPPRFNSIADETATIRVLYGAPDPAYSSWAETVKVAYRDEFITSRMYAIDMQYSAFETALLQEKQQLGFLTTTTNIALTGTASLINPVATKNILTMLAAGLTGAKAAFNDEILYNKTIQVLQNQMRANRSRKASLILVRLGSPSSVYPLGLALSDLEEYYQAGTLTSALLEVTGAVAQDAINAKYEKEGAIVIARPASDDTRRVLVGLLYPKGRAAGMDTALRTYLRELLGPDAVFLPQFIVDPQYAMVRLNMINCIRNLQANNRCAANSLKVF